MKELILLGTLVALIMVNGCNEYPNYWQDQSNINSPLPKNIETQTPKPTITPSIVPEIKQESTSKVKALNIGETAVGTNFKLTVNGVRSADRIDYIDNIYGPPAIATEGKQYVIIDLTLENISPEPQRLYDYGELIDEEGYSYSKEFYGFVALEDKAFKAGEIPQGMKRRGEIPYSIPKDAKDLKFMYKLDLLAKEVAIFNIPKSDVPKSESITEKTCEEKAKELFPDTVTLNALDENKDWGSTIIWKDGSKINLGSSIITKGDQQGENINSYYLRYFGPYYPDERKDAILAYVSDSIISPDGTVLGENSFEINYVVLERISEIKESSILVGQKTAQFKIADYKFKSCNWVE